MGKACAAEAGSDRDGHTYREEEDTCEAVPDGEVVVGSPSRLALRDCSDNLVAVAPVSFADSESAPESRRYEAEGGNVGSLTGNIYRLFG